MTSTVDEVLGIPRTPGPAPDVLKGWLPGDEPWLDLRERNVRQMLHAAGKERDALHKMVFSRVAFGDRDRETEPADLTYASFAYSTFEHVSFANTGLVGVYFRGCKFTACDFRYTYLNRTSFQDAEFENCDFYRAFFEAANIFTKANFKRVSFDKAWLAGVSGLTKETFERGKDANKRNLPMAQECDEEGYADFLEATQANRPASHAAEVAVRDAMLDVAEIYRSLSGMWTEQGQLRSAGFAYVRCKALERDYYSPLRRWNTNRRRDKRNSEREREAKERGRILDRKSVV
jgi:uncharacterized protein YjbI with pentapeptide repeats